MPNPRLSKVYEGIEACMPIGTVLTIAAAGSEMSNASIITNENGWLKRGAYSPYAYCKFAVMNPELTYTLPAYQTASGCTDIIVHILLYTAWNAFLPNRMLNSLI